MPGTRAGALKSRWARALLALIFLGACAAAVAAAQGPPGPFGLIGVRFGGDAKETRIVLDLADAASARAIAGDTDASAVVLQFPEMTGAGARTGVGAGLIHAWSLVGADGGAKLTLKLGASGHIRRRFALPPADGVDHYRYVVDIDPAGTPPPVATDTDRPPEVVLRPKVVVIDAGHGGKDPGAQGRSAQEKDVTLAAARTLKARLEREGRFRVVMTRDSDVFVPLDERVQIARRAGADLFISLHADSGEDAATHGASVYTLSEQGGSRVARVLSGDEWFRRTAARDDDPAVGQILLDLSQRSTRNRSVVFAEFLVERIAGDDVALLPRSHRDAGYFVLLAPDVPAALLEMGFITSPTDEARLTNPAARAKLMDAVAAAIDAYFDSHVRLAAR